MLPKFLRPGLARQSVTLALSLKDPWPAVRALYDSTCAPLHLAYRSGVRVTSTKRDSIIFLTQEIVLNNSYTPRWFYRPVPCDVAVDIGANIGIFALHFCQLSKRATVFCFEPDPRSFATLHANVVSSNMTQQIFLNRVAVWSAPGLGSLANTLAEKSIIQSFVHEPAADPGGNVRCISLTEALLAASPDGRPVAILKIDAEGSEAKIISGCDYSVMQRVERVAFEYHSPALLAECVNLLKGFGFHIWQMPSSPEGICLASRTELPSRKWRRERAMAATEPASGLRSSD